MEAQQRSAEIMTSSSERELGRIQAELRALERDEQMIEADAKRQRLREDKLREQQHNEQLREQQNTETTMNADENTDDNTDDTLTQILTDSLGDAREGALDGVSASIADVGVRALVKRAGDRVPANIVNNQFVLGLITAAVPWIILAMLGVLGDRVPKAAMLRKQARRAIRALSSRYSSTIMTEGLGWLMEIAESMSNSDGKESDQ